MVCTPAHVTASRLAETVLHEGIDQQALARGYGKTVKWLAADNRFGRMVFAASRVAFTMPVVSRIVYQAFATECKVRDERSRPLTGVLWKIASGTADYREVLREMCGYAVLRSFLSGTVVTLRNVAFELLFGLKWGEYGRYPTVVLKEKREVLKDQLASGLGMELANSPDFERMYAIKIRGSEEEIMEELAKFGQPHARFVKLRFVNIRQVEGSPNQVGSVIRYRIPFVGLGAKMRLTKRVGLRNLALSGRRAACGPCETHLQRHADQGRKPPALHLHGVRLQERQGLCEPDDVEGRQIIVSRVRTRRRVEPCPVHHQGRGRAEARPHLVGLGFPTLRVPGRFMTTMLEGLALGTASQVLALTADCEHERNVIPWTFGVHALRVR